MTLTLRRWQAEVMPLLDDHIAAPDGPVVIVAATGSGKSVVQAELCARLRDTLPRGEVVVYATSRTALVDQIARDMGRALGGRLGRYDGRKKDVIGRRVVVTTYPSLGACVARITAGGAKVGAVVLDEAHNSEAVQAAAVVGELRDGGLRRIYGFTATAFRSDIREALTLFDRVLYRYDLVDGIDDGVLVPFTIRGRESDAVEDVDGLLGVLRGADVLSVGPGLVTCDTIEQAGALAELLTAEGIRALPVHSGRGSATLAEVEAGFRGGTLDCIVSPRKVSEGYDYPPLAWVCLYGSIKARVKLIQTIGRALRAAPPERFPEEAARWGPKRSALILDPNGLIAQVGLAHDPRVGIVEVEEKETKEREVRETKPDPVVPEQTFMAASDGPVAFAAALMTWLWQQPEAREHVAPLVKASAAGATRAQAGRAEDLLRVIETPPPEPEPRGAPHSVWLAWRDRQRARAHGQRVALRAHVTGRYLVAGLELVQRWGMDGRGAGAGRKTAAEVILRSVAALVGYREQCRKDGRQPMKLPLDLLPIQLEGK